ncbi:lecithin retinol acyltransferase family protein [Photobacterium sp. R1]
MAWPILRWLLVKPAINLAESFIDNVLVDKTAPKRGSVVYCDLAFGYADHSGIYIGNGQIVHLNRKGMIEVVSASAFIRDTTAISIYVSCDAHGEAIHNEVAAKNAEDYLGKEIDYHPLWRNCHQFASYCVSGESENNTVLLMQLKSDSKRYQDTRKWRVWDRADI